MQLRQLELFVAVAEEQHFGRAALRVHVSQSAVSVTIRALESDLGTPLLVRTPRGVGLTPAGERLLPEARRTLLAADQARAAVADVAGGGAGRLVVGTVDLRGTWDQTGLIRRFLAEHPGLSVRFVTTSSDRLMRYLTDGSVDIAIVDLPVDLLPGMQIAVLASGAVELLCRTEDQLTRRRSVTVRDIADQPLIIADWRPGGSVTLNGLHAHGVNARSILTVDSVGLLLDLVADGQGITLARPHLTEARADMTAIPVVDLGLTWTIAAVTPPPSYASPASRAYLELLEEFIRQ